MKTLFRLFALIVMLFVVSGVVGCGKKEPDPADPNIKKNALKVKPGVTGGGGDADKGGQ